MKDKCDRCECSFDEYPRSTNEWTCGKGYGLDLCQECDDSFHSWIRCKIG